MREVRDEVARHGAIVHESINWAVVLTQGVIVARAAQPAATSRQAG
jgi:hypothetical protein